MRKERLIQRRIVLVLLALLSGRPGGAGTGASFPGSGTGPIDDAGTSGTCWSLPGTPREVTFSVSGITRTVTDVRLDVFLSHTWLGDLELTLSSPGGTRSLIVFGRVGATSAESCGDSSDLGTSSLLFSDSATANLWDAAFFAGPDDDIPGGKYRTTELGGEGQTDPAPLTRLSEAFRGLAGESLVSLSEPANGIWTLSVRDGSSGDVGSIDSAFLTINPPLFVDGFESGLCLWSSQTGGPSCLR